MTLQGQIDSLLTQRAALTNRFPALANMAFGASGTNSSAGSLSDLAEMRRLATRVAWLQDELTKNQSDAANIIEIEPLLASMRDQLALDRTNYQIYVREFESARTSESVEAGKQVGIGIVEEPTPPSKNTKKIKKLLGAVFGGFSGLGLGLAFLIDMFLDRSIKRGIDI